MQREYHRWHSPRLGRTMELLVFGHAGAKTLVFPTRNGRFYEYESLRVVERLAHKLEAGHLQLFCVDSVDHESLYCLWKQPAERIQRHAQFEEYILHEVLPFMQGKNSHPCTIAHGCSLGAYHAANIAFRHPHLFRKLSAFSGRYDLTLSVENFTDLFNGYYDDAIYFHTPSHFMANLECNGHLQHLRNMDITLVVGKEDPFLGNNQHLSAILHSKGINHHLHEWAGRAHCGYFWRRMASHYL
jgi:esterase/lipase superfamily enzyme